MSCNAINPMVFIRGNTTLDTSYDTSRSDYPTMGLWRICLPLSLNFIAFAFLWWKHRKALKAKPAVFKKIGHVAGLFIYPVKSCRGISLEASNCLIEGLQNDRYSAICQLQCFCETYKRYVSSLPVYILQRSYKSQVGTHYSEQNFQRMIFRCTLTYRSEDCTGCLANRTESSKHFSTRRGSTLASTVFLISQIFHDQQGGSQLFDQLQAWRTYITTYQLHA